mgnify:CR=1 FL=1
MNFRVVSLPPFQAATSGVDKDCDFSPSGILGKFDEYFSAITPSPRDSFLPRDFLFFNEEQQGLEWWWALEDGMDLGGNAVIDFDGGFYLTYTFKDGDEEENGRLYRAAMEYIQSSEIFELDIRPNHYPMGHIITPAPVIQAQGWSQMEVYVPVKLTERASNTATLA